MAKIVKVISTSVDELSRRLVKFLGLGLSDIQETREYMPWGVDGVPIKDAVALYTQTSDKGKPVIIGYLNKNQIAEPGELRFFSTDDDGTEKAFLYLKKDGEIHMLGNDDYFVRYNELELGFNALKEDFNNLVTKFNAHTHTVPQAPTGVTESAPTSAQGSSSDADISDAKIDEIKTLGA